MTVTNHCDNMNITTKGACPNYFGNYNVIVTLGGEGVQGHDVINYNLWAGKNLHALHVAISIGQ